MYSIFNVKSFLCFCCIVFTVTILSCKKKTIEEASLGNLEKQLEEYYRSLPDFQKLQYGRENRAYLSYNLQGKVDSLEENLLARPSTNWEDLNAAPNAKYQVSVNFDRFGRVLRSRKFEIGSGAGQTITADTIVEMSGDTIKSIKRKKRDLEGAKFERDDVYKYNSNGNFTSVTHWIKDEIMPGIIAPKQTKIEIRYRYNANGILENRNWIQYRDRSETEFDITRDTTFNPKGIPIECREITYFFDYEASKPNDTLTINKTKFVYDNKGQLREKITTEETRATPTRVSLATTKSIQQYSPYPTSNSNDGIIKTVFGKFDRNNNWTEKLLYTEGDKDEKNPSYKIVRRIVYFD